MTMEHFDGSGASMGAVDGWVITRDGETLKTGFKDGDEAFRWLHNHTSQSWDWEIRYGGYDVVFIQGGKVEYSAKREQEKERQGGKLHPEAIAEEFEPAVRRAFIDVYGDPDDEGVVEHSIRSSYFEPGKKLGWTEPEAHVVLVGTEYAWVRDMFEDPSEMERWENVAKLLRKRGWTDAGFDSLNAGVHVVYWSPEAVKAKPVEPSELGAVELIELGDGMPEDFYAEYELGAKVKKRTPLAKAKKTAAKVERWLKPFAQRLLLAGSLRRKRPEIGDIEFVILPKKSVGVEGLAKKLEELGFSVGPAIRSAKQMVDGIKIEIYIVHHPNEFGAMSFMYTGDRTFNFAMRKKAMAMGYLLNQYGIWTRDKSRAILQSPDEKDFFEFLKVPYHTPEERSLKHRTPEERRRAKARQARMKGVMSGDEEVFFTRLESVWGEPVGEES